MSRQRSFGITGHQDLPLDVRESVRREIEVVLAEEDAPIGYSCLAEGADQIFAECILRSGGSVVAILPADDYAKSFQSESALDSFKSLLSQASRVLAMRFAEASEDAYWAAGQEVVRHSETLIAVWDGKNAAGLGGTGDVVSFARSTGVKVRIIWPEGARRG